MTNNRNSFSNKKKNRYNKKINDLSNNNIFLFSNDFSNSNNNFSLFDDSNNIKLLKLYSDSENTKKNNINNKTDYSNMNNNKLITYLDSKSQNKQKENDSSKNEELFLKFLIDQKEKEFISSYNSPFFTGSPSNFPQIAMDDPFINEEAKNIIKEQILIDASIDNLIDLIELCNKYPLADNVEYNINMKSLHAIKPSLMELQNMIGMQSIKENIVDQIIYFIQDLHNISPNNADYMHAVIYGPPGTGKTEVAKIMGKIFSNLGMLKKNVFKKVTRDDLVAGYLGQTALKTKDVIKECIGGVLFIDEAYALGNKEKRDSFSKESIDTICEALSDHKKDLMCIIAGYEQELKDCFFSYNPGLESRFTWKFKIDDYNPTELRLIFEKKITDNNWSLKEDLSDEWFEKNKDFFSFFGRDMETLFSKVKIAHSRRVFCLPKEEKTKISIKDLEKGFEIYKKMGDSEKRQEEKIRVKNLYNTLYC
jgi:AAA+ superfamily predicted ATPase